MFDVYRSILKDLFTNEGRGDSLALEAANQIKHLKESLKELVSIVEIHSKATGNNFAWAELEEAKEALES
jgi:hypothetical protein